MLHNLSIIPEENSFFFLLSLASPKKTRQIYLHYVACFMLYAFHV